jgi:NTE family protein
VEADYIRGIRLVWCRYLFQIALKTKSRHMVGRGCFLEAAGGFEPPYNGFADRRLTTWLSRLDLVWILGYPLFFCQGRKLLSPLAIPLHSGTFQFNPKRYHKHTHSSIGLVLSAGGAKGAYQIGCWKAFIKNRISFCAVAGSSIGALNGALVCQGDFKTASDLWIRLADAQILEPELRKLKKLAFSLASDIGLLLLPIPNLRWLKILKYVTSTYKITSQHGFVGTFHKHGLLDITEFRPELENYIDMEKIRTSPIPLYVTVSGEPRVSAPLGLSHIFRIQDCTQSEAWNVLGASMALPFVFSRVSVRGRSYADGGLSRAIPIEPLIEHGVKNLIVVSTKKDVLFKQEDHPDCNILVISPGKSLGRFPISTFSFSGKVIQNWIEMGYQDAQEALESWSPVE